MATRRHGNGQYAVQIGQDVFMCDGVILHMNSKYFRKLYDRFPVPVLHTSLPNEHVSPRSFSKIYNAMCHLAAFKIEDDLIPLFVACSYLECDRYLDECKRYIMHNLDTVDVPQLLMLPQLKQNHFLYAAVKGYVCRHFSKVYHRCLLYTSPSPRDRTRSRMPSSA